MKNTLSKIKTRVGLSVLAIFLAASVANAATLSLSPTTVNVVQGQNVTMAVVLNPQGQSAYTTKVELRYPANLLEVKSFNFSGNWLPLTQSGYDLVDNTNGVLVKTAGYPGGISSQVNFGTVTFLAKSTGTGTVTVSTASAVYDSASQNTLTGVPLQAAINISTSTAPASTSTPAATTTTPTPAVTTDADEAGAVSENEDDLAVEDSAPASLMANLGNIVSFGTGNWFVALIVILAIAYGVYWIIKRKLNK